MTTYAYIVLQDSSGSGGNFAVPMGGYNPEGDREQSINKTVGGTYDISQGENFEIHRYTIRCRHTEDRSGYGTFGELIRLWKLNNPKGTPTDRITFTDHFGVVHYAYFEGKIPWGAITTVIEGLQAWYFVPIVLRVEPS